MSDFSSEPGEEEKRVNPPPQGQDIEEIKQQFEQQQSMIAHLKGVLQSNEQQLANKEKEIEQYGAKLSSIKSRTKIKRSGKSTDSVKVGETSVGGSSVDSGEATESGQGGSVLSVEAHIPDDKEGIKKEGKKTGKSSDKSKNIVLLRKKLEENRMKFEQRGKEMSESKKSIEEMVETLRMQLAERDQVIETLQKDLENKSEELLPSKIQDEVEHVALDSNVSEQLDKREMYAQIVYKDNKIVELNNRIMELEVNVLDLQENLKEKDAVIDARTKAITLMSEDMSRKSKSTLDSLDDTREQMRLMQNNFITLEARMKDEKDQLNKQLEEKDRKLKQVEESHKKLETVRFDLTTRIAELQEKVVHLQTINSELQKEISDVGKSRDRKGDRQDRVEELLKTLDENNKQMIKIKAQHKNKVKSLTKQIESLKRFSESSDEILRLQQRVAELEEDKGNLQLHLVDFDELKASENHWERRIKDLEEKIKQQNEDLDSHVHALSRLESEKLNLMEDVQSERLQIEHLESELKTTKAKLIEQEKLKVSAEMKAVELEELNDILSREKTDLSRDNKILSDERSEYKQLVDSLQQEKAELLEEVMSLQAQVRESNPGDTDSNRSEFQMVSSSNSDEEKWKRLSASEEALAEEKHVKDSSNIELSVKLLESELEDARRIVSEQKDIINDLTLKVETKEEEIEMHQEIISKLEQLGQDVALDGRIDDVNKISEILKELNEMTGDLEEWKKRCSEVEDRLKCLEDEKTELERKLDDVTNENSVLNAQLNLQKQVSDELAAKFKEESLLHAEKNELIKELENTLEQVRDELSLKEKDMLLLKNKLDLNDAADADAQQEKVKGDLENLKIMCSTYENELVEKDRQIAELAKELQDKIVSMNNLELKLEEDLQSSLRNKEEEIKLKDNLIKQLENELQNLKDSYEMVKNVVDEEKSGLESSVISHKVQELEKLLSEKEELLAAKESELENSNQKLKSVTEKVKKIAVNLKAKTVVIQNLEEKEKKYADELHEKEQIILQTNSEKESLQQEVQCLKFQCEEKDSAMQTLSNKLQVDLLERENKVEELLSQNRHLLATNESLQLDIVSVEEKKQICMNQISELEEEIDNLRNGLNIRDGEIASLKEKCAAISSLEEEKKGFTENNVQLEKKNQELIAEIVKKEDELTEVSQKLDEFAKSIEIKNDQIESHSLKYKELEQLIVGKDMQISALEDRLSGFQNSWGAKLQEHEAYVESLEQELAKSHARQQHLEEGLSFIEERRRSIEHKFTALGEQLQESDRFKEEAAEHEGLLENRLAALVSSEDLLRKRLEMLSEQNIELNRRISDLGLENEEMKKNLSIVENNLKIANREIERLSPFETDYNQAQQTIENLEKDLKRYTVEFERSLKERELDARQYIENMEVDMKSLSSQVEALESEKRCLMEHCERLNDMKINLEEDIETYQEKCEASNLKIQELGKVISQNETTFNSIVVDKDNEIRDLKQKMETIEKNTFTATSGSFDNQVTSVVDQSDLVDQLKLQLDNVTATLSEKESEIHSYQSRLLQLQFGGSVEGSTVKENQKEAQRIKQLEDSAAELEEKLRVKSSQLEELKSLLASANNEMSNLQQQLSDSCKKIEEMSFEMDRLHRIVEDKDRQLQMQMEEISVTNSNKLSHQLESINVEHHTQLTNLQHENSQLYNELVQEKAKNIVNDVLESAQQEIEVLKTGTRSDKVPQVHLMDEGDGCEEVARRVKFDQQFVTVSNMENEYSGKVENAKESCEFVVLSKPYFDIKSDPSGTQELVEKLGDLRAELDVVKSEKKTALMKVEQLEGEVNRLLDVEEQLANLQGRLHLLVAREGSSEVEKELFSKESSVDSEGLIVKGNSFLQERGVAGDLEHVVASGGSGVCVSNTPSRGDPFGGWGEGALGEEAEEGDGWGWGAEEARLEEEHMQKQQAALSTSPADSNQLLVVELNQKIEELEKEKCRLTEELKASQVRSGKVLKKLKELKIKNENLMRENQELALKKSSEFSSLDLAIEEELKLRIDSLEKELKECRSERDTLKMEKDGLHKRVETLTATNERLLEREQGFDSEFWQSKNKELVNQIETLQWRIEELMEEKAEGNVKEKFLDWNQSETSNLQELQDQIGALSADNEHLQSMLEEQRNLRVAAEAALKDLEQLTSSKEANLLQQESDVKEEYVVLQENYELVCKELEEARCNTGHDSLIAENSALRENYEVLCQEVQQLRSNSNNDLIAAEYATIRKNYEAMYSEMEQMRSQVELNNTLQANYESLQIAHSKLITDMNNIQKECCDLTDKYERIQKEKSQHMEECSIKFQTTQENFEIMLREVESEKREVQQRYEKISLECESHLMELQELRNKVGEHEKYVEDLKKKNEELNQVNIDLNNKYELLKHSKAPQSVETKQQLDVEMFKPIQFFAQTDNETTFDTLYKSSDIVHEDTCSSGSNLQVEVNEFKEKIAKLEEEKNQKIKELTALREMFAAEQEDWATTEQTLSQKIEMLEGEIEIMKESVNRESQLRESLMLKEHELSNLKSQLSFLEETLSKAQYRVEDLEAQLIQKEEEMQDTNLNAENQENMIHQIVASKEEELTMLRETLAVKEQEQRNLLLAKDKDIDNLKLQISDLEGQVRSLITMKNQDLQNLKIQMGEMESKMHAALEDKDNEVEKLQIKLAENDVQIQELLHTLKQNTEQIAELQETLEAREDEIREAVLQIRDRNVEIQRLRQGSSGSNSQQFATTEDGSESEGESSQQNELDAALYMLHQRDMRCEELTLELMKLLEERDTLQLRLSTALRINEEIRQKSKSASSSPVKERSSQTLQESENTLAEDHSEKPLDTEDKEHSPAALLQEPQEDLKVLADKLSQLHSVDYRRDVTIQDERVQRHNEQMMLLQPRGPGVLVESNYTLSRDVQSPSTVLLNWIWGRSTPKVMHI